MNVADLVEEVRALRDRVRALEDLAALRELQAAYWRGIDMQRPDELCEVFSPRGVDIDFEDMPRWHDREAFVTFFRELGCSAERREMHFGQNPQLVLTGPDTATGLWHLLMFGYNFGTRTVVQISGVYDCGYVRHDGRWWIRSMVFRRNTLRTEQIAADGAVSAPAFGEVSPAAAAHLFGD